MITIITRACAGLKPTSGRARPMSSVAGLILHCTAGRSPKSPEESLEIWRSVQRYHQDNKGWDDIGYNFGVDDYGQVLEGRGWKVRGAHAGGKWNSTHHGLAYLGDGKKPSSMALLAIKQFIDTHDDDYGEVALFGHRDITRKACPGDGIYAWMMDSYQHRNPHV